MSELSPVAWREWQDKFNDYIYREKREHLPHPDRGEPLFLAEESDLLSEKEALSFMGFSDTQARDRIEHVLREYRLQHSVDDTGDSWALTDALTPRGEKSIALGLDEIHGLADAIACELSLAHERDLLKEIDARDSNAEMADKLADAIAALTGAEIGEHSSGNCPWQAALDAAERALENDFCRTTPSPSIFPDEHAEEHQRDLARRDALLDGKERKDEC